MKTKEFNLSEKKNAAIGRKLILKDINIYKLKEIKSLAVSKKIFLPEFKGKAVYTRVIKEHTYNLGTENKITSKEGFFIPIEFVEEFEAVNQIMKENQKSLNQWEEDFKEDWTLQLRKNSKLREFFKDAISNMEFTEKQTGSAY